MIPVPLQKGLKAFPLARCPRVVDEAKDEDAYEASDDQQSIYSMASSIYKNLEFQASNVKNRILAFKLPSWNGITNWASSASHQPLFVASDFRRIVCSIRACSIQCTIRFGVRSRGWIFRERIESRRLGRLSYKNSFERLPSCGIRRWDWLCFWIHIWFQNCVENPFMPQIPSFIEDSTFGQARRREASS